MFEKYLHYVYDNNKIFFMYFFSPHQERDAKESPFQKKQTTKL